MSSCKIPMFLVSIMYRLLSVIAFIVFSQGAYSYDQNFKNELCSSLYNEFSSGYPDQIVSIPPGFTRYGYPSSDESMAISKSCIFSNESDTTLNSSINLQVDSYGDSERVIVADIECLFTSDYVWNCGYKSIELGVISYFRQFLYTGEPSYYKNFSASYWQGSLLELFEESLNENY